MYFMHLGTSISRQIKVFTPFAFSHVLTSIDYGHHNPSPNTSASSQKTIWQPVFHL
ncbi:MAG: hypothetical protein HWQ58_26125 [Nostoc sp. LPT]|nr:hypothetical protein [Nostoc sp. LPT]